MKATKRNLINIFLTLVMVLSICNVPVFSARAASSMLSGEAHVQTFGDTKGTVTYENGYETLVLGTRGKSKRVEQIVINFDNQTGYSGDMVYRVHRQTYGWTDWMSAGKAAGTKGQGKRLEGIEIKLTGELAKHYSVRYSTHIQTYGDKQGWQYDGALAGTTGEAKRLEEIKVQLVPRSNLSAPKLAYRVHRQTYGWEPKWAKDGGVSGTTGQSKRLEGITIAVQDSSCAGGITYRTHVQTYGWMDWVYDGEMSGTQGKAKRLEAIQIKLTGDLEKAYDVYYRVHAQTYGWLSWAKNGESAGTSGLSKRLEAIQIVLVKKGQSAPAKTFGGITAKSDYSSVSKTGGVPGHTGSTTAPAGGTNPGGGGDTPGGSATYVNVEDYTYEIIPLLAPFDTYFYVKTDNPDPRYVRFVDKESVYFTEEDLAKEAPCAIRPTAYRFSDVVYENYETGRVKGGYIFVRDTGYDMDGGSLVLQQADKPYIRTVTSWGYSENVPKYKDTATRVNCPKVKSYTQYLVDTYTDSNQDLFTNLDRVQSALDELALYPKGVLDTSKPVEGRSYPFLATSPYYELSLNDHYEIYESADSMLALAVYPFLLHSLTFPGTMGAVARMLEPNCTVESGGMHYMIKVEYNGTVKGYGGAGTGSYNDLYSKYVEKLYKFDGSADDYAYNATLGKISDKYFAYQSATEADMAGLKSMVAGDEFYAKTKSGTWIRTVAEGFGYGTSYAYVTGLYDDNRSSSMEDVWVDGRYVDKFNRYRAGVHFGDIYQYSTDGTIDTSKSDIIIRNMTFQVYDKTTRKPGKTVTRDVRYVYDSDLDCWRAAYSYMGETCYPSTVKLPENMKLTHEQVDAMVSRGEIDGNTDKIPESGLIYDGTAAPGTPFKN